MIVIGVTGGTGVGKSVVSEYLAEKGYPVIDADKVAKLLVEPGMPLLDEYVKAFGEEILFDDGSLNRKLLGEIVFADSSKLKILNDIVQKVIIKYLASEIKKYRLADKDKYVFIDAPLIVEWRCEYLCDVLWLVDADIDVRAERIMKRDGISRKTALDRIDSQLENERKKEVADLVLDNSKDLEYIYQQIEAGLEKLSDQL